MSSVIISGDTSGAVTLAAPAVAGTNTLTLLAATATSSANVLATAVASTSGTSIDFTSIPSWVKRITVMLNGVSTSSTSNYLLQIGSGSIDTATYISACAYTTNTVTSTNGFTIANGIGASDLCSGVIVLAYLGSNVWAQSGVVSSNVVRSSSGSKTLSGTLDRIRITSVMPDTFDAGSVNILYEG